MILNAYLYNTNVVTFGQLYAHPELRDSTEKYVRMRDCLDNRVKLKGETYLPDPSEVREKPEVKRKRYETYLHDAQWLPVTRRTQQGLVAQVFIRQPEVTRGNIPEEILNRISINGGDVRSLANYAMKEVIGVGRGAFVVGIAENGEPMIDFVETEHILTWSMTKYGTLDDLGRNWDSVVVRTFRETLDTDGITTTKHARLSQYRLDTSGKAWVRHADSDGSQVDPTWQEWLPCVFRGTHLKHIPVHPVGSESNTFSIMPMPLEEMGELNISHFCNSASYEEHVKLVGQVTIVFTGLKDKWYTDHVKGQVAFGVRTPIPLNEGANAALLQAQPNSTAKEAMDKKEKQMIAIGARLIEERQVRKTATESGIEEQSYHSILGHIAYNCSIALSAALRDVSYMYGYDNNTRITLTQEFGSITLDAEHRRLALEEFTKGVLTIPEYRAILRGYSQHVSADDEQYEKTVKGELAFREELATIGKSATTSNTDPNRVSGSDNRT